MGGISAGRIACCCTCRSSGITTFAAGPSAEESDGDPRPPPTRVRNQEKGVLAKWGFAESSVTLKTIRKYQGWELNFGKGVRMATFQFSESGSSLNGPDLFSELPFL